MYVFFVLLFLFETLLACIVEDVWSQKVPLWRALGVILATFGGHAENVEIELTLARELKSEGPRRGSEFLR